VSSETERITNEIMNRHDFDWLYENLGRARTGGQESRYVSGDDSLYVNIRPAKAGRRPTKFLMDE
jgi:hypothetical protein